MARAQLSPGGADTEDIRRLARFRPDDAWVSSVFVDLDPARFATPAARRTQFDSLLAQLDARIQDAAVDHEIRAGLTEDRDLIRAFLDEVDASRTDGLAIFSSARAGLFDVFRLEEPVQHRVEIGPTPWVEPLVRLAAASGWLVLLANRRIARTLRGSADRLHEVDEVEDPLHGQHKQGGWSQARYERSVETDVDRHLDHVSRLLHSTLERRPYAHLLLGGSDEMVPRVERVLHPNVQRLVRGRFAVDVEHSSPDEVLERARPVMEECERSFEREALDRLADALAHSRGTAGPEDTFAALIDRRVGELFIDGQDGWGDALTLAAEQSADVRVVRYHDDLIPHGGVAALLRY
jgi:hypothetical protein